MWSDLITEYVAWVIVNGLKIYMKFVNHGCYCASVPSRNIGYRNDKTAHGEGDYALFNNFVSTKTNLNY